MKKAFILGIYVVVFGCYINSVRRISMSLYLKIFTLFFKVGLFTIGGGYAMLPMFRQELIEKNGFISEKELLDYYSIGQCTPGIIAINVATFVGYRLKGIKGAILATFAIVLPSLLIIIMLASVLNLISDNKVVNHAFAGIRLGVIALILNEVFVLFKKAILTRLHLGIFIIVMILLFLFNVSAVMVVLFASSVGVILGVKQK